jgi:FkbM family methyltransferase
MNKRLQIFSHWLKGPKNNVSAAEILYQVFKPGHHKTGKQSIHNIIEEEEYYLVYYKGFKEPLYWPKEVSLRCLYGFSGEIFDKNNWHYYEIPETTVNTDDIVLDCGAAEGIFTYVIMNRCKKAYALEPLPVFIKSMQKTFAGSDHVEIIQAAASDSEGIAAIKNNELSTGQADIDNTDLKKVELKTIDSLFYDRNLPLTFIKADLEGFELKMLDGCRETIAANLPRIAITTYHEADHAPKITEYLKQIAPDYNIKTKGIAKIAGCPVMLHAWV